MRSVAISSLITGGVVLLIYIGLLIGNNYINPTHNFSLDNAAKIAPFVGSCVGVFFSLAGTLLIFENLRLTNRNNERNQILTQKNQFESVYFNMLTQQRQIRFGNDFTILPWGIAICMCRFKMKCCSIITNRVALYCLPAGSMPQRIVSRKKEYLLM